MVWVLGFGIAVLRIQEETHLAELPTHSYGDGHGEDQRLEDQDGSTVQNFQKVTGWGGVRWVNTMSQSLWLSG